MIITISREYGSGGHTIGKSVARELGIEFYDRDIIKGAVKESGLEQAEVERAEEEITRTGMFWRMISPAAYVDQPYYIRSIEQHIILEFAMKGPCVILGRCADDTLEKAGIPSLNVFLYASDIHRAVRVGELIGSKNPTEIHGNPEEDAEDGCRPAQLLRTVHREEVGRQPQLFSLPGHRPAGSRHLCTADL